MQGDKLAAGGKSATFGGPKVSQERWDEIFGKEKPKGKEEVQDGPKPKRQSGARQK